MHLGSAYPNSVTDTGILLIYAVISFLRSLAMYGAGLISADGFEHSASTSRLAFLQRSASGTVCLRLS